MDMVPPEKRHVLREQLWSVLHEGHGRLGHAFNFLLIILILVSVAIVPLEFLPAYRSYRHIVQIIEAIIVAMFTVEYVLRLYASPNRLKYIFSFFGIVDLLSIVPFYTGLFGTEYIRVLRLVRFFKLAEIESAARNDETDALQRGIGLVPGESVEYIVSKSPLVLIFGMLPPLIAIVFGLGTLLYAGPGNVIALAAAAVLFLFALIFLWKAWLDYSYDVIYVTNYRLIFQNQHLLGRSINQVNFYAITNVKPYYPSAISYIFRYGSLVIDTAAEYPGQIGLHMVRKHEEAAKHIMQLCFASQKQAAGGSPGMAKT